MSLRQPVPAPVEQKPVTESNSSRYPTEYQMPYQAAPPPSPMVYHATQPVASQVAYHPATCELAAYGPGCTVHTCPAAQTTFEPVDCPSTSHITYPPGYSGKPSLWESTPRLYPLRDLSLSNTRYFDKRDPYVMLLLVLAAHDIDFKYVKMADLSRQLPERHLWLKNPLDANAALQSYITAAVELLEAFEQDKVARRQHRPQRVSRPPHTPPHAQQRRRNRTPRPPQGSGSGSPRQKRAAHNLHPGGRSGIRRRNRPGWRSRRNGRIWRSGRNGQPYNMRHDFHGLPNGSQSAPFDNNHSTGTNNAQEVNTGRFSPVPKQENDSSRDLGMDILGIQHSQPSSLQTSGSNPSPESSMTSYSNFSVVPRPSDSDPHPDPLSEASTMTRDIRQALLSVSEPNADLNGELPSYPPTNPLRSYCSV